MFFVLYRICLWVWLLSSILVPVLILFSLFLGFCGCVSFYGCSYLFSVASAICRGGLSFHSFFVCMFVWYIFFLFVSSFFFSMMCHLWNLGAPARGQAWTSEVGDLSPGCWTTRKLLTPWNINQWEFSERPPSHH